MTEWGVLVEILDKPGDFRPKRPEWNKDGLWADKAKAENYAASLRKEGRNAIVEAFPFTEDWEVWVEKRDGSGQRRISAGKDKAFYKVESFQVRNAARKAGREAVAKQASPESSQLIKTWLSGDVDFDEGLQLRLAKVARDIKHPLLITSGLRTIQEQEALYQKYLSGKGALAAKPGHSNHNHGQAADVVSASNNRQNIGSITGARSAMRRHGLCLPVPGEPWHVEIDKGQGWRS